MSTLAYLTLFFICKEGDDISVGVDRQKHYKHHDDQRQQLDEGYF